jgi:Ca2+/Na+ antiporter
LRVIANKYNLSERFTGYILAFGSSIPEFSTNLISATSSTGNINIGVGDIAGSGSYGKY